MPESRFRIRESYADLIERAALTASGVAVFVPAIWLLMATQGAVIGDAVALGLTFSLWIVGLLPVLRRIRWMVQTSAGLLLMISPVFLGMGPAWIQPTIVGFAVIVGVMFSVSWRTASAILGAVTLLDVWLSLADFPAVAFAAGTAVERLSGPLLLALAGTGLVVTTREWTTTADFIDNYATNLRQALASEDAALRLRIAHDAVRRRVHETVLNTLNAIGLGLPPSALETARRSCARDLVELDKEVGLAVERSVRDVLLDAVARSSTDGCRVRLDEPGDVPLDGLIALALGDAVVESVRNANRHSGTHEVRIAVALQGTSIRVDIVDDGVGIPEEAVERFGVRSAVNFGITSVGGTVEFTSHIPTGTRVRVTVPILTEVRPDEYPVREMVVASPLARLGLMGTPAFLLLAVGPLTSTWASPWPTRVSVLVYAVLCFGLLIGWKTHVRVPVAFAGTGAIGLILWTISNQSQTCSTSESIGWLLLALMGGGAYVFVLAQKRAVFSAGVVLAIGAIGGWCVVGLPTECRTFPLLGVGVGLSYLVAVAVGVWMTDGLLERRRRIAQSTWDRAEREHATREARIRSVGEWSVVDEQARTFLLGVADGTLNPLSEGAQEDATRLAANVRERLVRPPQPPRPMGDLISSLHQLVERWGTQVSASVTPGALREDPYPRDFLTLLLRAVELVQPTYVHVQGFADGLLEEIVVSCVGPGEVEEMTASDGGTVLELRRGDLDAQGLVASLRRPLHLSRALDSGLAPRGGVHRLR